MKTTVITGPYPVKISADISTTIFAEINAFLKVEAARLSEVSVFLKESKRPYLREGVHHTCLRENLNSHIFFI
jgi:hypothetical protein